MSSKYKKCLQKLLLSQWRLLRCQRSQASHSIILRLCSPKLIWERQHRVPDDQVLPTDLALVSGIPYVGTHERTSLPNHGGRRQPMCDPEGCATVLGAVGGGGGPPPPPLWLTQTLGVGGSGGQPPGSPGGGGGGSVGTPTYTPQNDPMTH